MFDSNILWQAWVKSTPRDSQVYNPDSWQGLDYVYIMFQNKASVDLLYPTTNPTSTWHTPDPVFNHAIDARKMEI